METHAFEFQRKSNVKFVVPSWFKAYWYPNEDAQRHWQFQYQLAKEGKEHRLPEDRLRMPGNKLHQIGSLEFWREVPKDFNTILDIGCNDGYMVKQFLDAGKNAVGVDEYIYPTDRLYTEEHGLDTREMDMHCLGFDDESFDAVWCRHTLEHSFVPLQVLAEIYRILKKDGYLFVILPPPPDPPIHYPGHWHQIPDYQLRYLLELCSFKILSLKTVHFSHLRENDNLEIRAICRKEQQ